MGVDVDEAGSDDLAACVDFLGASAEAFADRDDPVAVDCDIRDKGRAARTIDDGAAANHQIIHVRLPNLLRSEEHTSELQSLMRISYAVFCLKKIRKYTSLTPITHL